MLKRNDRATALGMAILVALAAHAWANPASANPTGHPAIAAADALPLTMAQAGSCNELWLERNEIFKGAGYCFRTARAIQTFGNAGCQHDNEADVPLSQVQRRRIADIRAEERSLGCTR